MCMGRGKKLFFFVMMGPQNEMKGDVENVYGKVAILLQVNGAFR